MFLNAMLQTYGIKHKKTNEIEVMTYVDYVEIGGAAWFAGMRRGTVIISLDLFFCYFPLVKKIMGKSVRSKSLVVRPNKNIYVFRVF